MSRFRIRQGQLLIGCIIARMFGGKIGIGEGLIILVLYALVCSVLLAICLGLWLAFSKKPFPWKKFIVVFAGLFVLGMILSLFGC